VKSPANFDDIGHVLGAVCSRILAELVEVMRVFHEYRLIESMVGFSAQNTQYSHYTFDRQSIPTREASVNQCSTFDAPTPALWRFPEATHVSGSGKDL
jgi:hypothetical protein